ncbi:MAG TPA: hypothetical protein VHG72_20555 [Polyangia bacterium]|nr:hypothetical protein [Polyangia bacterium]
MVSTPWKRKNPKAKGQRTTLTEASRSKARARAAAAGRKYPNLVDNMWAVRQQEAAAGRPGKKILPAKKKPR